VSIIMMLPTLISSLFGMNLVNGLETNPWGFPVAMLLSVVVSAASWWLLRRKRLL
jgi:transporter